jgi:regulatory protein
MDEISPKPARQYAEKPAPKPLGPRRLNDMALAYVARFATSAARLEAYLTRKLRERGWEGDTHQGHAAIQTLIARFVDAGYVDDETYARMKSGSLLRRGYGARRIDQALNFDGIDEPLRADIAPNAHESRQAALIYARKKRLGPYAREVPDAPLREKHLASFLRAGHAMGIARKILATPDIETLEQWAQDEDE